MNCPVCGTSDTTCGVPHTGTPVDAQIVAPPIRKEAEMPNEMILVEHNGGRFRVNPRDLDTYMEQHPGAKRLDVGAEEPEAKAVAVPPANKATPAPSRARHPAAAAPEPSADPVTPPETGKPVEPPAEEDK